MQLSHYPPAAMHLSARCTRCCGTSKRAEQPLLPKFLTRPPRVPPTRACASMCSPRPRRPPLSGLPKRKPICPGSQSTAAPTRSWDASPRQLSASSLDADRYLTSGPPGGTYGRPCRPTCTHRLAPSARRPRCPRTRPLASEADRPSRPHDRTTWACPR